MSPATRGHIVTTDRAKRITRIATALDRVPTHLLVLVAEVAEELAAAEAPLAAPPSKPSHRSAPDTTASVMAEVTGGRR